MIEIFVGHLSNMYDPSVSVQCISSRSIQYRGGFGDGDGGLGDSNGELGGSGGGLDESGLVGTW